MRFKKDDIVTITYGDPTRLYRIREEGNRITRPFGRHPIGSVEYDIVSCNIGEKVRVYTSEFEDNLDHA